VDVPRFLGLCEGGGVEIVNRPSYIREWIKQERKVPRVVNCGFKAKSTSFDTHKGATL